ncbi:hypothetical protein [Brevibacillus choshinensis]|uniref:hypothetical protein n=1 Tax=Brevibacillus choshinensis TaxID=54911 RepID=UPI002E1A21FE|nr:hypothetical protein [Brevibacillus choshinensis]MED4755236.1 hypothetical protein [Brevibacillus choshinensis]
MNFTFPKQEKKGTKIEGVSSEESSKQKEEQIVLDFVWAKGRVRSNDYRKQISIRPSWRRVYDKSTMVLGTVQLG